MTTQSILMKIEDIIIANQMIRDVVTQTPLQRNEYLSNRYDCNVYLKERIFKLFAPLNTWSFLSNSEFIRRRAKERGRMSKCRKSRTGSSVFL